MNHYKGQFLACNFFTVESLWLQTLFVLFFIEHGTRPVYLAGCTAHPTGDWVTQQARQMSWELQEREDPIRYLIHDHDKKFPMAFDTVFEAEGVEIVDIPYQAPNANAFAERWVRTVREECLDKIILLNERHLYRTLQEYLGYYNTRRPIKDWARTARLDWHQLHKKDRSGIGKYSEASFGTTIEKLHGADFPRGLVFGQYGTVVIWKYVTSTVFVTRHRSY